MMTKFRGLTTTLIYQKTLRLQASNDMNVVTIMSTDVDRVSNGLVQLNEVWGSIASIGIGIWLLWRQLGPVAVAPVLLVLICFSLQTWTSKYVVGRQSQWMQAIGKRVDLASTILRAMKSIKLAGLVDSMVDLLQAKRAEEIRLAKHFRWLQVTMTCISNIPNIFSAFVAFAGFSIQAHVKHTATLTTAQAFTSLAIVSLLTGPTTTLLTAIPALTASYGCLLRIQAFLVLQSYEDSRSLINHGSNNSIVSKDGLSPGDGNSVTTATLVAVEICSMGPEEKTMSTIFQAHSGSLTMVFGPVGSGKSTLLKEILGEKPTKERKISVSLKSVAYCAQTPWLQNSTIRDNITGLGDLDHELYKLVLHVCALNSDIENMPLQDMTLVGSKGFMLSGGQKSRIVKPQTH